MELQGSTYLYTLATVSMTYVAFTLIFVFVRQTRGGILTPFELFSARNYLKISFISVTGALLPPLGSLLNLPEGLNWRIASAISAALVLEWVITLPRLRRAITAVSMPPALVVATGFMWAAGAVLIANTVGFPVHPGPGLFALGVTLPLFVAMWFMVRRIGLLAEASEAGDWDPSKG